MLQNLRQIIRILGDGTRFFRDFADNGKHRSFDRLLNGLIRGPGCFGKPASKTVRIDQLLRLNAACKTTPDLGQDDTGVAARAHQRPVVDLGGHSAGVGIFRLLDLAEGAAHCADRRGCHCSCIVAD